MGDENIYLQEYIYTISKIITEKSWTNTIKESI